MIAIVAFEGVQPLDVTGPASVFAKVAELLPRAPRIVICSPHGGVVEAEAGIRFADTVALHKLVGSFDLVLVAGGSERALRAQRESGLLQAWLQTAACRARRIGSVCTGAFVLAEAGLLDGRRVTTHWAATDRLRSLYPKTRVEEDAIFVIDGAICTSAGVTAGIDLALAMVEADHGAQIAGRIARELVVFLRRPGGQSQYSLALRTQAKTNAQLQRVIDLIIASPEQDLSVLQLAKAANMSERTFARRFREEFDKTPGAFAASVRIERAKALLETTDAPLASIAMQSGYASAEALNHVFRRSLGISPGAFRARFSRVS